MKITNENDILFDDLSILTKFTTKNDLISKSSNNDCDCGSYTSTTTIDESDTNQITPFIGQTDR